MRNTSVGWMFKMICTRLDADMSKELNSLNLNLNEFAVLMTLLQQQGITQTEIGKKIIMPGYSTSRNLDSLEEKELVERRTDAQSRRNFRIFLTDKGREMGPKLFNTVRTVNQHFLSELDSGERKQLTSILQKLVQKKFGLKI